MNVQVGKMYVPQHLHASIQMVPIIVNVTRGTSKRLIMSVQVSSAQ